MPPSPRVKPASVAHELRFPAAAYSVDAIQRAAYRMCDRLSLDLHLQEDVHLCRLHLSKGADEAAVLADFRRQVLDETLRERIRSETADVRNVILALAFSETGLVQPE